MPRSSNTAPWWHLPPAVGAVGGQVTLAAGSFVLQLLVARSLGATGLGVFAMLFGCIVIATAVTSGLVGDSLTVLDRHDPRIRSALAWMGVGSIGLAACVALAGGSIGGLDPWTAVAFAAATAAFMGADLMRRLLMACRRFWRLVVVDSLAIVATLAVLAAASAGDLRLGHFLAALCVGQSVACVVAWSSLPQRERTLPQLAWGDPRAVAAFGCWRAAQQFVRPTTLNAARWLVLVVAGQAAVGQLEAARLFVAPALLLVSGVGSFLFSSYANEQDERLEVLLARADRGAGVLLAGTLGMAVLAVGAAPVFGHLVTDGDFDLASVAVLGWGVYAASCAVVLPYGSLAAVRGHQARVLGLRLVDSLVGIIAVAVALWWWSAPPGAAPWLLSIGSVVAGVLVRQRLLVPGTRPVAVPPQEVLT